MNAPSAAALRASDWRISWRAGYLPQLNRESVESLRDALRRDDSCLVQGMTVAAKSYVGDAAESLSPATHCCPVSWTQREVSSTVADVYARFRAVVNQAHLLLLGTGTRGWAGDFLYWWDHTPRAEARNELLAEIEYDLLYDATVRQQAKAA